MGLGHMTSVPHREGHGNRSGSLRAHARFGWRPARGPKELIWVQLTKGSQDDASRGVYAAESIAQGSGRAAACYVRFGKDDHIGCRGLLCRLGVAIQMQLSVDGVDRTNHEVYVIVVLENGVGKDREENGSRVREPGRLHDHPAQRRYFASIFFV